LNHVFGFDLFKWGVRNNKSWAFLYIFLQHIALSFWNEQNVSTLKKRRRRYKSEQFCLITFRFASWIAQFLFSALRYFIPSHIVVVQPLRRPRRWYQNVFLSLFRSLSLHHTHIYTAELILYRATELIELLSPFELYRLQRKLNKCLLCCFWRILLKKLTRDSNVGWEFIERNQIEWFPVRINEKFLIIFVCLHFRSVTISCFKLYSFVCLLQAFSSEIN
jgi:hypothetical protein